MGSNLPFAALVTKVAALQRVISFIGNGMEKLVERSLAATGEISPQLLDTSLTIFRKTYENNLTTLTRPYPGVQECLGGLKSRGARLGICTNKPTDPAKDICDRLDLAQYFDVILGAEPGHPKKSDAAPLLSCISALGGSAADAVYLGDSEVDYQTAINAHIPFRLFSGGYLRADLPDFGTADRFDDWAASGI